MNASTKSTIGVAVSLLAVVSFWTQPGFAQDPLTLLPGGTLDFHDAVLGRVVPDGIEADAAFGLGISVADPTTTPLSTFVIASGPLGHGRAEVLQFNDFVIDPGSGHETMLMAQFAGEIDVRGFMVLVGSGQMQVNVELQVLDITDGTDNARVIAAHPISSHAISNNLGAEVGLDVDLIVGSATIGQAGIALGVAVSLPFSRNLIRDDKRFGITALVRRGHTYRIQVVSESRLDLGLHGGTGVASLYSPLAPIPETLADPAALSVPLALSDPAAWIDSIDVPFLDRDLPSVPLPNAVLGFVIPGFQIPLPAPLGTISVPAKNVDVDLRLPAPFNTAQNTNDLLETLGFGRTVGGNIAQVLELPAPEPFFTEPGVDVRELSVDLEHDILGEIARLLGRPLVPRGRGSATQFRNLDNPPSVERVAPGLTSRRTRERDQQRER